MAKGLPGWKHLSALAALVLAFWAGRASMPESTVTREEPVWHSSRFPRRTSAQHQPGQDRPGAGGAAITSAQELRDIFKQNGGNLQAGKAMADVILARMNGAEISCLVRDLAAAQASSPGYFYTLEINTACSRWAEIDPDAALRFVLSNKQGSFRSAAIGSVFGGLAKIDPELARARLSSIDDPTLRGAARTGMLSALATARPDDWVAAIKAEPASMRQHGLGSIASEWAMDDPVAAAARIEQLPVAMQRDSVASIAKVWAGKDPQAAMAWAQSLTDPRQRASALGAVAGGIAAQDPDGALAALNSLEPAARRAGLASVFQTLTDLDFDSALERASALTDPADRKAAFAQMMGSSQYNGYSMGYPGSAAVRTPEEITALITKLPPGSLRSQGIATLGNQLAGCSSEEAAAILETFSPGDREKIQTGMIQALSYTDPARAMEIYQSMTPYLTESYISQNIISNLARQDPDKALKYALAGNTPQEQAQGAAGAFAQFATDDPAGATRRLDTLPVGPVRDAALSAIAAAWGQADPAAARAWAESLNDGEQTRVLTALIAPMAATDPKTAAGILGSLLSSSPNDTNSTLHNAASNMMGIWSAEDPAAAGTWSAGLPDGNVKNNAIQTLTRNWVGQDPDAAATWLDNLPEGKARDSGVQAMVDFASRRDPASAFAWAASINSEQQRAYSLESIVRKWKDSAPDEARAAIKQADVSDTVRESLLKALD